ncbi:MAG: flagellar basal body rod protein FlgB [Phycisphaerales bacterium]|nr:flagellar basal body rod protein FlgB [Phycisphaerales bacterium]
MFIDDITNSGAIPVLEASMRFAAQRQRMIAGNIANISTPDYRQKDVSVKGFEHELARAVDARRDRSGGESGRLELRSTQELRIKDGPNGQEMTLSPRTSSGNILFHDRNNRDIERLMQDMVETAETFRTASEFMRGRLSLLRSAIAQRAG